MTANTLFIKANPNRFGITVKNTLMGLIVAQQFAVIIVLKKKEVNVNEIHRYHCYFNHHRRCYRPTDWHVD